MPFLGKVPSQVVDSDVDIDGGSIDGVSIGSVTANAGAFTNLTATGTLTLPDDGISGDDVNGGTISSFASTGIDDNATSTAITISSSENVTFAGEIDAGESRFFRPSNFWTASTAFFGHNYGSLATQGSFDFHLTANGYRNSSGTWTSLGVNSQVGASQIALGADGKIEFNTDATKNTGDSHPVTIRMTLNNDGNIGYSGKLFSSNNTSALGGLQLYRNHANGDCYLFDTTVAPYSGDLIFGTNNTERARISASGDTQFSGNVGIGGVVPTHSAFHIFDSNSDRDMTTSAAGQLHIDGNGYGFGIALNTDGAQLYTNSASRDLIFGANETEVMRLTPSGMGIGTGSSGPTEKLEVSGGSILVDAFSAGNEEGIFFRRGFSNQYKYNMSILAYDHNNGGVSPDGLSINSSEAISFCTGSNSRNEIMRIAGDGRVGISKTIPSHTLDVNGSLSSNDLYTGHQAGGGASLVWYLLYERHYRTPNAFDFDVMDVLLMGGGQTGGSAYSCRLLIAQKQQHAGDQFSIFMYEDHANGLTNKVAYKYDSTGGNASHGLLQIWVQQPTNYVVMSAHVRRQTDSGENGGGDFQMVSTGSTTQPSGTTLVSASSTA